MLAVFCNRQKIVAQKVEPRLHSHISLTRLGLSCRVVIKNGHTRDILFSTNGVIDQIWRFFLTYFHTLGKFSKFNDS